MLQQKVNNFEQISRKFGNLEISNEIVIKVFKI